MSLLSLAVLGGALDGTPEQWQRAHSERMMRDSQLACTFSAPPLYGVALVRERSTLKLSKLMFVMKFNYLYRQNDELNG